jgi:hypothetical protein
VAFSNQTFARAVQILGCRDLKTRPRKYQRRRATILCSGGVALVVIASTVLHVRLAAGGFSSVLICAGASWREVQGVVVRQKLFHLLRGMAHNHVIERSVVRRLVEVGLTVAGKPKHTTAATADRAKELASKAIDSLTAGAANNDEKASRKRRLIKGPEEFREVRVDRPKAKGKS